MDAASPNLPTRAVMAGGILTILLQIEGQKLLEGALLTAIGTTVSYLVTLGLRWVIGKIRE